MRSWDNIVKTLRRRSYIMGYLYHDATDSNQLNPLLCPYWGKWTVCRLPSNRRYRWCGRADEVVLRRHYVC